MSEIVNDRDVLLQAAPVRDAGSAAAPAFFLVATPSLFLVDAGGLPSQPTITIAAQLVNIEGIVTWEVTGAHGLTVANDTRSAMLTYDDVTADEVHVQAAVTYRGVTRYASAFILKVAQGQPGAKSAQVYAYKRAAVLPTDDPGDVIYTFAAKAITTPASNALANGWSKTIPEGAGPLYVRVGTAYGSSDTDAIASAEWAAAAKLAQDGLAGLNSATVTIYQRSGSATAPALPTVSTTYTFATGVLTGLNNGWSTVLPASGGAYLHASTATAAATTATDAIPAAEWAAARLMAQDGAPGSPGVGTTGPRGTVTVSVPGYSAWPGTVSAANAAFATTGYGSPVNRDTMTLYSSTFGETRFYNNGSWIGLGAYIHGNMLIDGTLSADSITTGELTGVSINIGSGNFQVRYDSAIAKHRVTAQYLSGQQASFASSVSTTGPTAVTGPAGTFLSSAGSYDTVKIQANGNTGNALEVQNYGLVTTAHAIRGKQGNPSSNSSGIVGCQNGRAFWAEFGGYGPFTGSHDGALANGTEIEPGDIVVDVQCLMRGDWSNTFFEVAPSTMPCQKGAVGVYVKNLGSLAGYVMLPMLHENAFVDDFGDLRGTNTNIHRTIGDAYFVGEVNAVGEGQINVCGEGGNVAVGDFIVTSSMPGKGMRLEGGLQLTGDLMSCVVARAREAVQFDTPDQVRAVACIYLAG